MHETEKNYRELLHQLEHRHQIFVSEYLVHFNATRAARKAGYSTSSSHTTQQLGYETLLKPDVAACIRAGTAMIIKRCEVDADKIVRELAAVAFSNKEHYIISDEGDVELDEGAPAEAIRAVASVKRKKRVSTDKEGNEIVTYETEYRLWDKLTALTLLGKKLKLFVDKIEVENPQDEAYRLLLKTLRAGEQKQG